MCHLSAEPHVSVNLHCSAPPSPDIRVDLRDLNVRLSCLSSTFSGYYVMTDGEAVNISATFSQLINLQKPRGDKVKGQ